MVGDPPMLDLRNTQERLLSLGYHASSLALVQQVLRDAAELPQKSKEIVQRHHRPSSSSTPFALQRLAALVRASVWRTSSRVRTWTLSRRGLHVILLVFMCRMIYDQVLRRPQVLIKRNGLPYVLRSSSKDGLTRKHKEGAD